MSKPEHTMTTTLLPRIQRYIQGRFKYQSFTTGNPDRAESVEKKSTAEMAHRVRDRFQASTETSPWELLWKDGLTPWDIGRPTPLLCKELERFSLVGSKRTLHTLVPGCGAGYDLATLAAHHGQLLDLGKIDSASVTGLDLSENALQSARRNIAPLVSSNLSDKLCLNLICGDFFNANTWKVVHSVESDHSKNAAVLSGSPVFDFIFDYTFFCALSPSMRNAWGRQTSLLLDPETGQLLTLIFPITPEEDAEKGPPYRVSVADYRKALEPNNLVIRTGRYVSEETIRQRKGIEQVCWWNT
jgi:SAM-dependent methyltransferase